MNFTPLSEVNSSEEPLHPIERPSLVLGQGEQRLIQIPGLIKYSLGSRVVRVLPVWKNFSNRDQDRKESLLLKGILPGRGDIWVWKKDGVSEHRTIRVEKVFPHEKSTGLEKALAHLEETEIIFSGNGAVLRGEVRSLTEAVKIHGLTKTYPKKIHDETEVSEDILTRGTEQLARWLKASGLHTRLRLESFGKNLWLRGNLDSPREQIALEKQARAIFPLVQTEIESLPDHSPTVYFRVFLLEIKRTQFRSLGISWPGNVSQAFQISGGMIHDTLKMDLNLQHLEGKENIKILSNPELVVRAPGEAELFAGGEIPIQIQNRYFSDLSWKKYGLSLRLKVTHATGERIRLEIFTEVSHLDASLGQDKIPGVQANRMKTQVDARFGVPLLLSGLLQNGVRQAAKGLPFLRGLPVLGVLFGSEDYLSEKSELVAILYPHSAPPTFQKSPQQLPSGPIPLPRNWVSPRTEQILRESKEYPWNALE